jgi:hypothetical protein
MSSSPADERPPENTQAAWGVYHAVERAACNTARMTIRRWQPGEPEDLSGVLRHINRLRQSTRSKIANDPLTSAILDAAMTLIEREFRPEPAGALRADGRDRYPFFSWLSRPAVAKELATAKDEINESYAHNVILDRWRSHEDFLADVLAYALRTRHWSLHIALAEDAVSALTSGLGEGDFVDSVHEVAFEDLKIALELGAWRLQLVALACAEKYDDLRPVLLETYSEVDRSWIALYEQVFAARGWRLRPGLEMKDLNIMLSSAAEGMALRALVDPQSVIDDVERTSALGDLALALILSCVDDGSGRTLDDAVRFATADDKVLPLGVPGQGSALETTKCAGPGVDGT